ncbi:MAG: sterol desaturase family protein [Emticicia sp.]|nr:sterol desaturase family protein [Emticicia sp.]
MNIFTEFFNEIIVFFRIEGLLNVIKSGNFRVLLTFEGFLAFISPITPFVIFFEFLWLLIESRFRVSVYKITFLIILTNRIMSRLIGVSVLMLAIGIFQKYAIIQTTLTWYWFIYGYLVYELNNFIRHYLTHKVRFLWCFHAVHHSPEDLNSSVTLTTFFVENLYSEFFAAMFCMLLGVQPLMLFAIMILDSIWGAFVHVSENTMKNARLGFLEKFILTPSHHRVHHGSNHIYMDTNFCSILNVWDIIFKTYQEEKEEIPVTYGITRPMDANSFVDVYFGEIISLWHDVIAAPGLKNKIAYVFMPPGWSHIGEYETATTLRNQALRELKK